MQYIESVDFEMSLISLTNASSNAATTSPSLAVQESENSFPRNRLNLHKSGACAIELTETSTANVSHGFQSSSSRPIGS